jgi:hypothetical protein
VPSLRLRAQDVAHITNCHIEHLISNDLWKEFQPLRTSCRETVVGIFIYRVIMFDIKPSHFETLKKHLGDSSPNVLSILSSALLDKAVALIGLLLFAESVPDFNTVPSNFLELFIIGLWTHQIEKGMGCRVKGFKVATHVRVVNLYDLDQTFQGLLENLGIFVRLGVQKVEDTCHEFDLTILFSEVVLGKRSHSLDSLWHQLKAELFRVLVISHHVGNNCLPNYFKIILLKILWLKSFHDKT